MLPPRDRPHGPPAAVALGYQPERDRAPRVVAAGRGAIAQQILALAQQHGIPLREDDALVQLLLQVPVGRPIPAELYAIVAEILAAIYRAEQAAARH